MSLPGSNLPNHDGIGQPPLGRASSADTGKMKPFLAQVNPASQESCLPLTMVSSYSVIHYPSPVNACARLVSECFRKELGGVQVG